MRLTKDVIQKLLNANEGFIKNTDYSGRNFKASYQYLIKGGQLLIREVGKTSWADSRFDNTRVADIETTRRIIRKFLDLLNTNGIK